MQTLSDDNTVCALVVASGYLFSGSYQHMKVWDLESYECVTTLAGHNHWVCVFCYTILLARFVQ